LSRKGKSNIKWWTEKIDDLKGLSENAQKIDPAIAEFAADYSPWPDDDVGDWALLKLCTLRYYVEVYSNVAKKHFDKTVYIDLFAGDGFNYLRGVKDVIIGSPLVARVTPNIETKKGENKAFDKMILVEKDETKASMLRTLVEFGLLPENTKVFCCDANAPEVMEYIKEVLNDGGNNHYLAFIDPYTMEIEMDTLKELFKMNGDLIINFMASSIQRPWGNYHSPIQKSKPSKEKFDKFFGDESWLKVKPSFEGGSVNEMLPLYIEKINGHREIIKIIKVTGNKGKTFYYMIFAIRRTYENSPWLKAIDAVKPRIECVDDKFIEILYQIYRGKQETLDSFNPS